MCTERHGDVCVILLLKNGRGIRYNVNREKVSTLDTICVKGTGDIMKKIISIIAAAAMLTSSGAMLTANAEDSYISEETVDTEALERAYTLIKQFVEEQKEDKYSLFFRSAEVCRSTDFFADEDGEIPDNFINEIVIVCDAPDISIIEPLVSKFMQENDINEEIVTYITKDIARVVTKGDINFDNEINVADSTYITQYLAAPDEFLLSDDQKYTADVTGSGDGITAADALAIQQYLTGDTTAIG